MVADLIDRLLGWFRRPPDSNWSRVRTWLWNGLPYIVIALVFLGSSSVIDHGSFRASGVNEAFATYFVFFLAVVLGAFWGLAPGMFASLAGTALLSAVYLPAMDDYLAESEYAWLAFAFLAQGLFVTALINGFVSLRQQLAEVNKGLGLLVDASARLSESLNYERQLDSAVSVAVPSFADLCIIDILEDGRVERAVVSYEDPRLAEGAERLRELPPVLGEHDWLEYILATGEPLLIPDLESHRAVLERNPLQAAAMADIPSLESGICVPLTARGKTLGTMILVTAFSNRRYTLEDLAIALQLGVLIGSWLDTIRLLEQAQAANHAKDEFMGMISHEMRTPLTVIGAAAHILRREPARLSHDQRDELVTNLDTEASRLRLMVENLLLMLRTEDAEAAETEPAKLDRLVPTIVASMQAGLARHRIHVRTEPVPLVAINESYFDVVMRNVIGNALKYSPPDSDVEVVVEPTLDDWVRIAVLDRGPGVPESELDRIFERFYRSPTTKGFVGGSGLGLPLSRRLVSLMGGTIKATNRPGGGLIVSMGFPPLMPSHKGESPA